MAISEPTHHQLFERFHNFDDGVLRSVGVRFRSGATKAAVDICISARDMSSASDADDVWMNVVLEIEDVTEFCLTNSPREYNQVLSSGVCVQEFDRSIYVVFNAERPPSDASEVRRSSFYVAGAAINYRTEPFRE